MSFEFTFKALEGWCLRIGIHVKVKVKVNYSIVFFFFGVLSFSVSQIIMSQSEEPSYGGLKILNNNGMSYKQMFGGTEKFPPQVLLTLEPNKLQSKKFYHYFLQVDSNLQIEE